MHKHRQMIIWGEIAIFLLICFPSIGQINLVLNPSFEQYNGSCSFGQLGANCSGSTIKDWQSPTNTSPDWFNSCVGGIYGVPQNKIGYQYPRTGNSYTGFLAIEGSNSAYEYIEGQFSTGLTAGKKYCVTFYVSLADSVCYAASSIGAYLSVSQTCKVSPYQDTLPYIPQIRNPLTSPLIDKVNWVPISGEYNALGGEKYITIGKLDSLSGFTFVSGGAADNNVYGQTYYYVDDVSVREIIQAHAGAGKDTLICAGSKVFIGQDTAIPGISYSWIPTTGLSNPNAAQTFALPTVTTTYTLIAKNDSMRGCNCPDSISRDSVTITVDNFPGTACCNTTITSGQSTVLITTPSKKYIWSPTLGLNCDTCQTVIATPSVSTTYYVTMSDGNGCTTKDSVNIIVKTQENCGQLFVPDAFSPNNDGQNDVFLAKDNCVATFSMTIYDRWGNKVFQSNDINSGWDGMYGDKPEDAGTFVYYVSGTYNNGNSFSQKGDVTLVR